MHGEDFPEEAEWEFPKAQLLDWLDRSGYAAVALTALAGDVSARRYFRVELCAGDSAILACYPEPVRSACRRFAATTEQLEAAGVRVPALLAVECGRGLMLIEDLGTATLYEQRGAGWQSLLPYFEKAVQVAARIAAIPPRAVSELNPPLDETLLRQELEQTWEVFLLPRGLSGDARITEALRYGLDELCHQLGGEQPVPCHRDFMGRNLVPQKSPPDLAVLDHQDLRLGPPFYDLASLCNDSLFPPQWLEERLIGLLLEPADSTTSYHRAAAQRTLKAIGTYEAFARRGFERHRPLIAPTLRRAFHHLRHLPETAALAGELESLWSPVLDSEFGTIC